MTQAQAIERGFTHFIEVWRSENDREGINEISGISEIKFYDDIVFSTPSMGTLYTVAIFLIKPNRTNS